MFAQLAASASRFPCWCLGGFLSGRDRAFHKALPIRKVFTGKENFMCGR